MPTLPAVLGYDAIASSIVESMEPGKISIIQGPPGVGKSWLAKGIGGLWEEGEGRAIVAEGDRLQSDVPFYPLNLALAALSSTWRAVGSDLIRVSEAGERVAGTGGIITSTIQMLVQLRPARQRARKLFLGQVEQGILFDLERLAEDRPLLLVADNLQWWDDSSLELLGRLRDPRMGEAFPFLAEMHLIAVQTVPPYEQVSHPDAHEALLSSAPTEVVELTRPSRESFPAVLTSLGAPPDRAKQAADDLYALTGAHLVLAARCAKRLQAESPEHLLSSRSREEFRRRLLADRVQTLSSFGSNALAILQIAAVLGLRFRRGELVCAFEGDAAEVAKVLRSWRDEEVIELSEKIGRFVHDLFQSHFLEAGGLETTGIHESIADCLRLLRPGEYMLRCEHAQHAEREREAATLAVHAALQRQREGLPWAELSQFFREAIDRGDMTTVVEDFQEALTDLNDYRFSDCQATLNRLPRNLPRSLVAEAHYLKAMCLIATRSEEDREAALTLLRTWARYETEEPELGIRLMHLQLYALTLDVDKTPGRELEGEIRQALMSRGDFDRAAEDVIYTLDRCSGSLHEPETSLSMTLEAARHFGPTAGATVIRRPVEYYRCLVNVVAKLVTTADYKRALEEHEKLERLVEEYDPKTFPRLDYPLTTALLAEYRLGLLTPEEAAARQSQIAEDHGVAGDPFYTANAEAIYLALGGSGGEALDIFTRLSDELARRPRPAPSMLYLIRANRCAVRYVTGDGSAVEEWIALTGLAGEIPYLIRRYLIDRHRLLAEVMERGEATSPIEFDECLLNPPRFGRLWDQLGRGFRMPEVEWWR